VRKVKKMATNRPRLLSYDFGEIGEAAALGTAFVGISVTGLGACKAVRITGIGVNLSALGIVSLAVASRTYGGTQDVTATLTGGDEDDFPLRLTTFAEADQVKELWRTASSYISWKTVDWVVEVTDNKIYVGAQNDDAVTHNKVVGLYQVERVDA
jgi:hypothetical protein